MQPHEPKQERLPLQFDRTPPEVYDLRRQLAVVQAREAELLAALGNWFSNHTSENHDKVYELYVKATGKV